MVAQVANGEIRGGLALTDRMRHRPAGYRMVARRDGDHYVINGIKT